MSRPRCPTCNEVLSATTSRHKCPPLWEVAFACDDEASDVPLATEVLGTLRARDEIDAGERAALQIGELAPDIGTSVCLWIRRYDLQEWTMIRVAAKVEYSAQVVEVLS